MLYSGFITLLRSIFWSADFNGRSDNLDVISLKEIHIKLQFSIRYLFVIVFITAATLAGWQLYRHFNSGLYSDEFAERLAKGRIGVSKLGYDFLDQPHLDVVTAGSTERRIVFEQLGISEDRLQNFRTSTYGHVEFLAWKISPSYELSCMSGARDSLAFEDPARKVYGVRIIKRLDWVRETQQREITGR